METTAFCLASFVLLPLGHSCSNLRLHRMFSREGQAERPDGMAPIDDFLNLGLDIQERRAVLFTRLSLSYSTRIDPRQAYVVYIVSDFTTELKVYV